MYRILAPLFFIVSTFISVSQTIITEKTIQAPGKQLGVFNAFGTKSVVSGAGPSGSGLTAAFEVADVAGDGFVVRKDYVFTKYNENLEKEWEKEIDKVYGLQAMPKAFMIGKKNMGVFFVQLKRNPSRSEIHITRLDTKGNTLQTELKIENKYDEIVHAYINEEGLNILTVLVRKKEKKAIYTLYTCAAKNLASKIKEIPLPFDTYEVEHSYDIDDVQYYQWSLTKELDTKLILQKTYFKDIEKSKKKEHILQTIELDKKGQVSNLKNYPFAGNEESKFSSARLEYDDQLNQLYVFGHMTTNSNRYIEGLYVSKYDYTTTRILFGNLIAFKKINELIPSTQNVKEKINLLQSNLFSINAFEKGSYHFDHQNHSLTLYLFEDAKGLLKGQVSLNLVTFDSNGVIQKIDQMKYKNHVLIFNNYQLVPESITKLYTSKDSPKATSLDFIHSFSQKTDPKFFFWNIFPRKDLAYDLLISMKEDNGEIKAYKISSK